MKTAEESKSIMEGDPLSSSTQTYMSTGGERKTKKPASTQFNTWESMSSSVNFLPIICYLVRMLHTNWFIVL
jgi:hypothetical protein